MMIMMNRRIGAMVMLVFAAVASAFGQSAPTAQAQSSKAAWQWTTEERLAARTDATQASERVRRWRESAVSDSSGRRMATNAAQKGRWVDAIIGREHPELFLPHELFDSLVKRGFVGETVETWRLIHSDDLVVAGLPADFWDRLEPLARDFIADLQETQHVLTAHPHPTAAERESANAAAEAIHPKLCRDRAAALRAARAAFGPALDQFLYTAVARGISQFSDEPESVNVLRNAEEGCR